MFVVAFQESCSGPECSLEVKSLPKIHTHGASFLCIKLLLIYMAEYAFRGFTKIAPDFAKELIPKCFVV